MKVVDRRDLSIDKGDIVIINETKYLVIFENTCIGWHFLNLETMEFNDETSIDLAPNLGDTVEGLGKIVECIKGSKTTMLIEE